MSTYCCPPSFVAAADHSCSSEFPAAAMETPKCNSNITFGTMTADAMCDPTDGLKKR